LRFQREFVLGIPNKFLVFPVLPRDIFIGIPPPVGRHLSRALVGLYECGFPFGERTKAGAVEHDAVIGAVGAPKRAKKDGGFTSQRDELYGSTAWGRTAETIVHAAEGDDGNRIFTVMHRNSPKEIFHMRFNAEGRLEEYEPKSPEECAEPSETTWFRERKQLAAGDANKLYWAVTDLATGIHVSDSTALRRIKQAMAKGLVQEKPGRQKGHATLYKVTEVLR
jgi:hypothetical protein